MTKLTNYFYISEFILRMTPFSIVQGALLS